jgi:hypothetical protein
VQKTGAEDDDGEALRGCLRGEGETAVVELVNNRPYGVVVRYGRPVTFGWSDRGFGLPALLGAGASGTAEDGLYIPGRSQGSIGVARFTGSARFTATPTKATIVFDIIEDAMGVGGDLLVEALLSPGCRAAVVPLITEDLELTDAAALVSFANAAAPAAWECFSAAAGVLKRRGLSAAKLEALRAVAKRLLIARVVLKYGSLLFEGRASGLLASFTLEGAPPTAMPTPSPAPAPGTPASPSPAQPTPLAPPSAPKGFTIGDFFLGGTWARNDPNNGTWHSKGNPPANGAYWYPNGLGVGVDCARAAAAYTVHFAGGRTETWNTWFHVTDGKWFPSAAASETSVNGFYGLPAC